MPSLSPTMTQGNIGNWKKKVGDKVSPGEVLVEIETDKATMDLEAQEEGFLAKILLPAGTKDTPIEKAICVIVENKEDVDKFGDFEPTAQESKEPKTQDLKAKEETKSGKDQVTVSEPNSLQSSVQSSRVIASPLAKTFAAANDLNLADVRGSGPGNRIVKFDVENALKESKTISAPSISSNFVDIPLTNMRKIIASRLLESKQTIPHYYLSMDVSMDSLMQVREKLNMQSNGKYKISVNDFIIKAAALALKKVPVVNSSWQGDFIRQFNNIDINVAVSTKTGLITPVIKNADQIGLISISETVKELADKAKENKLLPADYQGGTFTISNLGMYGIKQFTAIINPPQACILAVGAAEKREGLNVLTVTLSCDHRVVDGAVGAQWLNEFKKFIQDPLSMLL